MSVIARPSLIDITPNPVQLAALPDRLYAILKQRILSCELVPNQRLIEKVLCAEYRVSRTPLREALNRLSHEQLVWFQPRAGYRVAEIVIDEFRNLIELRSIVEPQAASIAAIRATTAEIAELRTRADLPFDPNDDGGFVEFCRANSRFHLAIVRIAQNSMLENIVMSALDLYQRPTYLRVGRQMDPSNPTAKHHAIVDAIERHQPETAHDAMYKHVIGGGDRILEALKAAKFPETVTRL